MYRIFAQIYFIYLKLKDASTNYVLTMQMSGKTLFFTVSFNRTLIEF